jgi:diguanylate cyclase
MTPRLDDLWPGSNGHGDAAALTRGRRRDRVLVVGAVGLSYLLDTLLLTAFCLAGTVTSNVPLVYGGGAAIHIALFSVLHWTGFSERSANPQLTGWQMVYAITLALVVMTLARQIATFFLALMFVIFAFGTLRISLRAAVTLWLSTCLAIASILGLSGHASLGISAPNALELTLVAISFATILLRIILLGYYGTALRMRALARADDLEHAIGEAQHLATHDALTGVANRRIILPAIKEQISLCRRKHIPAAVVMLDVDRFKSVNDRHGHVAGDTVLKGIAALIAEGIRASDQLGRYGGEEFILLLPATRGEEAMRLAERIRERIAATAWPPLPAGARITLSAGIAQVQPTDSFLDVITRADRALYVAKNSGRNRVCRYELIANGESAATGDGGGSGGTYHQIRPPGMP